MKMLDILLLIAICFTFVMIGFAIQEPAPRPNELQSKLIEQLRTENGTMVTVIETLQADRQCNLQADPEQLDRLIQQVHEDLDKSYRLIEQGEK